MAAPSNVELGAQPVQESAGTAGLEPGGVQSQRMETMGRLASAVAHDFANLLTVIAGYSELALDKFDDRDRLRQHLEEIAKAARRGVRLTSQLLGFTHCQIAEPRALDLNELIAETLQLFGPLIGEHIGIETALVSGLGKVYADTGQMEQVFMNLILNARDAMPQGGRMRIETADGQWSEKEALAHEVEPGCKVLLQVTDTGHGMDERTLARVFEPFFTTKQRGHGTGLGLHTVKVIVRQNGGDVWARSSPGDGATFYMCLPSVPSAGGTNNSGGGPGAPGGQETVLVVEDDGGVRVLVAHVLRMRGYRVMEAADAEEALRIFSERGAEIHLVLTDVVMPGRSGLELASLLLGMRPDTRLLFMSGYTDDALLCTGALGPGMSFLQKPLRPETLAAKVREALDSPLRPFNPR